MFHWVIVERDGKKHYLEMPRRLYYELVVRFFMKFKELFEQLRSVKSGAEQEKSTLYDRRQAMNSVVLYSALSLEGFIN